MAANTVLNYLPRESVVHRLTGTTKLAFFLLFTFCQHDYLQHMGASGTFGGEYLSVQTQQDSLQRSPFYDDFHVCFSIVE